MLLDLPLLPVDICYYYWSSDLIFLFLEEGEMGSPLSVFFFMTVIFCVVLETNGYIRS